MSSSKRNTCLVPLKDNKLRSIIGALIICAFLASIATGIYFGVTLKNNPEDSDSLYLRLQKYFAKVKLPTQNFSSLF